MEGEFGLMVKFAETYLPYGFRKSKHASSVARVRFEALACGITLALRVKPGLAVPRKSIEKWIDSPEFNVQVVSDASNSLPRLRGRIEFVRDRLLEA